MTAAAGATERLRDRVIVALDVPSAAEALKMVDDLGDAISFYKVGLELMMSGGAEPLIRELVRDKRVFVDLKLPGDIPETVRRVVALAANMGVTFLTLSSSVGPQTMRAAVAGKGASKTLELLFVPFLSSMDRSDFASLYGRPPEQFESFLEERTAEAKRLGADGFIVSGPEIRLLREKYPDTVLVSPGIRPSWSRQDDHKRVCTPAEAIRLGASYIVVGRPIRDAANRRDAAERIVDEIAQSAE